MTALTWSVKVVPGQTSQAVPVLAALGTELRMVYLGEHDQRIRHAVFRGGDWDPQGSIKDKASQTVQTSQATRVVDVQAGFMTASPTSQLRMPSPAFGPSFRLACWQI